MKITSKPGNGNKVHIYIDGEYTLTLYDDYWYRAGYSEGQEISDDELASLKEEAGFRSAYEKGITYLSMRAYSRKELLNKLKLKYGAEASRRAIEKMEHYGYIDDESFCRQYARHLFETKKYDVKRISYELRLKGVDSEIIDNTLKTLDNEPIQRIIDMLRTKYEKSLDSPKDVKRIFNRFVRMGYSFGDIKSAFEEIGIEIPAMR
ncbi:MAG: RecX family transcriptional regulator [Clostridia bacterium]|nr:RecX family transcriptional regulator [Clostridia bacterium]